MAEIWDALGGIGGAIGGIGSIVGAAGNIDIGNKNLQLEKDVFEYQKQQQDITRQREDTAVQRRMADMKAAGLNPVLAAGQAAQTSTPIPLKAPQRSMLPDLGAPGQSMVALATAMKSIEMTDAQIQLNRAQVAKVNADRENVQASTAKINYDLNYFKDANLPTSSSGIPTQIGVGAQMLKQQYNRFLENVHQLGIPTDTEIINGAKKLFHIK